MLCLRPHFSLSFLLKRKHKKCQVITHGPFQVWMVFSVLRLTLVRLAGFLIWKASECPPPPLLKWSVIALQCCVSSCCTTPWISCQDTRVPSLMGLPTPTPHLGHRRALNWALNWAPPAWSGFPPASYFTQRSVCILLSPDAKSWLVWKDPDAGKDRGQGEKGMAEDGWHHRLNGHGFEQAPGAGDGEGGLARCSPWGRRESDTTERLNWTECIYVDPDLPIPLPSLPPTTAPCLHVHSPHLRLSSCPGNRFICTVFLDSPHMCWYMIFVFLFLT